MPAIGPCHAPLGAIRSRPAFVIDQHVKKADQVLIGHGHWDHLADIPYIAKKTGAQVIGSETHANLMRAFGVVEGKIVQVKRSASCPRARA
jgi:mRNA degradation ribonuclease J1/J2